MQNRERKLRVAASRRFVLRNPNFINDEEIASRFASLTTPRIKITDSKIHSVPFRVKCTPAAAFQSFYVFTSFW